MDPKLAHIRNLHTKAQISQPQTQTTKKTDVTLLFGATECIYRNMKEKILKSCNKHKKN